MKILGNRIASALLAALLLGALQSLLTTLGLAWLYRDLVLPSRRFFPLQNHDAFTKLYGYAERALPLPDLAGNFVGPGFVAKLTLARDLFLIDSLVAVAVGLALALLLSLRRRSALPRTTTLVVLLVVCEVLLHVASWVGTAHFPVEPSWTDIGRNLTRNFIFDGTLFALLALGVTCILALAAARSGPRSSIVVVAACAVCALGAGATAPRAAAPAAAAPNAASPLALAKNYNVVLISIDSLRADHLGAYGYTRDTSPTIDRWAAEGVLYRNASSTTAWTLPAHMSLLTGRSLLGHGVISDDRSLTADVPTLAEQFQAAGYATGAIVSAPYLEARYGFPRGFDDYDDRTIRFEDHKESYATVTAPLLQETAAKWIESHTEGRFFLFLHSWDVHYDYDPGPPYETMFDPDYRGSFSGRNFYFDPAVNRHMARRDLEHIIALYDGEIRLVDDALGKLRQTLERLGIADRTIVVVTGDHGDEFFEHGNKGHHRSLYEEILRVPLVLYVPGVTPLRGVVETEASIVDIMPTLLELTGLPALNSVDGSSLAPLAFAQQPEHTRVTVAELYRKNSLNVQVSLRVGDTKVIEHFNRPSAQAFDTRSDPHEQTQRPIDAGFAPGELQRMAEWLDRHWRPFDDRIRDNGIQRVLMDSDTEQRLRSLGYIQ